MAKNTDEFTHSYHGTPCLVLEHTRRRVAGGTAVDIIYELCGKRTNATVNAANLVALPKTYKVGQNLSLDEVRELTGGKVQPGWYDSKGGQHVYICDGCHRDGYFGYKVLQLGGLS